MSYIGGMSIYDLRTILKRIDIAMSDFGFKTEICMNDDAISFTWFDDNEDAVVSGDINVWGHLSATSRRENPTIRCSCKFEVKGGLRSPKEFVEFVKALKEKRGT